MGRNTGILLDFNPFVYRIGYIIMNSEY